MIKINDRIHSTAVDEQNPANNHVVASIEEIFDDAKGKNLAVINQETDTALADRYTKDETYNKTELNQMVAPQHDYVTVATYADLANISEHPEGCVYRVSNYDGTNSQVDDTMYSEYGWNGTQYIHLATKSQVGEVFDISSYHASGGELAKYANLTAALDSNNGGGVPQSLQKGGMSVKFVQSSDNKYVQYRLMADTFSTTESDWQGVDDEPTANSENLVKSGGLHNRFNIIEEELGLPIQRTVTENVEISTWLSGFICVQDYDDGVTVFVKGKRYNKGSELSRCTMPIDISKYSKLRYKRVVTTNESSLGGMCFYTDENIDSVISDAGEPYIKGEELSWQYSEINVPAGAKYVRFSWRLDLNETFSCEGIYTEKVYSEGIRQDVNKLKNDVNSLQSTTQDLEDKVGKSSKSIIDENVSAIWIADGYVCYRSVQEYVEGKIYSSSHSKYSSFIDISKYSAIKYIRMITTRAEENILGGLCFYSDANEESVISGSGQGYIHGDAENSFYENEISIPNGAKYVRFSCLKEFINDFYCKGIYNDYVYSGGLGKKVKEISDDVEEIKETLYKQEIRIDPVLCRRRFYLAMTEWCKNHNLSDSVIIEGAGGGGIGGEVEDEQLGHGLAQYKVGDAAKILFNAYSYDFIANALCEKVHIAYTKGTTEVIELKSNSYDYFESILPDYKPMVWKTGTGSKIEGIMDENYCNLCAICDNEDFNGNLVLGVVRSAKGANSRYVMFKALMDIAKKLINNDQAINSEVETLINAGKGTNLDGATVYGNAIAIKLPMGNPKAYHQIDFNDVNNPYVIYAYNTNTPINTMSMIKLLTSIVVLDYVKDLDVFLTVTAEDRASVGPGAPSYNVLPEGCIMTIRDLLYAVLLKSSNVACYVLARYVGQFLLETYGSKGFIPDTENNVTPNN